MDHLDMNAPVPTPSIGLGHLRRRLRLARAGCLASFAAVINTACGSPILAGSPRWRRSNRRLAEAGQGTVEYVLVLLGAATVAIALLAWVRRTDLIGQLLDEAFSWIRSQIG